ncbi:MAG: hypothetical protein A3D87_00910 [Omnitrophica WOR_2 bacterium RIFCSPHIGHO2_02_FULL_50_17]|nr:MAG: hypothetical protein A3D87_00910 [Omnitrophica WOR_2 bacterium RIFCSPHIGHO2_02_FULL_50_17]
MARFVSVIIPSKNEELNIQDTVVGIRKEFATHSFDYEIIVVNDGGTDRTEQIVCAMGIHDSRIRMINNKPPYGFGNAIRKGLEEYKGDMAIITMADASDDPRDMVQYIRKVESGYDCCFGSRWGKGTVVEGYPLLKLILNRIVNRFIGIFFGIGYNDTTNAFKCYSRKAIDGIKPILSRHFNVTVELPLKAIVRGYSYEVIATSWRERRRGKTSLKLQEMGSRYFFIIMYVLLEKLLCGSDYRKS